MAIVGRQNQNRAPRKSILTSTVAVLIVLKNLRPLLQVLKLDSSTRAIRLTSLQPRRESPFYNAELVNIVDKTYYNHYYPPIVIHYLSSD